ncbi:hypothetical protein [Bradyrhizobium cytisi]|uniref:Uncharacterized protein n=1 Tax=Bradyrhizobium cytisi TaxID=515489 RepID=A0A5S4VYC9_9BRAD|nr:hypothetical protein [Bradyrhizobium cytisi]TYL70262.1 hypothetical protein FXB38_41865 [Bradyrhizobium cytisi]
MGVSINQFFNDPNAFLDGLIEHGYIVPGHPDGSRFFKLLEFGGAIFRVFSESEIKLWHDWVKDEAPSLKRRDRQRPKSLDERRLDEACRTRFNFVEQIAGERLGRLRQTASPRQMSLVVAVAVWSLPAFLKRKTDHTVRVGASSREK